MVTFDIFWQRMSKQLKSGDKLKDGWAWEIPKWSMAGRVSGNIQFLYRGGNMIHCLTGKNNIRDVHKEEFRQVYEYWEEYKKDRVGRAFFVHDLKLHNSAWTIPILKFFESLMK